MQLAVVTGASRGLGQAVAEQLLEQPCTLLTIARHPNAALVDVAARHGSTLEQWALDVSAADIGARLEAWLAKQPAPAFDRALLINNAGVMGRVGPIDQMETATLTEVLRVDLEAPTVLCAAFLRATRAWRAERRIVNVSSG